jgi:hypothetical protein
MPVLSINSCFRDNPEEAAFKIKCIITARTRARTRTLKKNLGFLQKRYIRNIPQAAAINGLARQKSVMKFMYSATRTFKSPPRMHVVIITISILKLIRCDRNHSFRGRSARAADLYGRQVVVQINLDKTFLSRYF